MASCCVYFSAFLTRFHLFAGTYVECVCVRLCILKILLSLLLASQVNPFNCWLTYFSARRQMLLSLWKLFPFYFSWFSFFCFLFRVLRFVDWLFFICMVFGPFLEDKKEIKRCTNTHTHTHNVTMGTGHY